jgi:biopolymer transport protein TolQ
MDTTTLAQAQAIDFSLLALFARSTLAVQIVMLLLIAMSVWSWAIIITKYIQFRRAQREAAVFDSRFWSGEPLDEMFDTLPPEPPGAPDRVFAAGMAEWRRSHRQDGALIAGAQARIDRSMNVAIGREADRLTAGLGFLATTGATAPFIGLFGTVWGIMNSFQQIAITQNMSLVVVAPGMAEALLTTAIGLVAAIPAIIFYNKLTADAERIAGGYEVFADEFSTILSRQLDAA